MERWASRPTDRRSLRAGEPCPGSIACPLLLRARRRLYNDPDRLFVDFSVLIPVLSDLRGFVVAGGLLLVAIGIFVRATPTRVDELD